MTESKRPDAGKVEPPDRGALNLGIVREDPPNKTNNFEAFEAAWLDSLLAGPDSPGKVEPPTNAFCQRCGYSSGRQPDPDDGRTATARRPIRDAAPG